MKKYLIFTAVLSALVFSACSGKIDSNEFMNNDEEYRSCMALISDNDLDENGFYNNFDAVSEPEDGSSVPDGKILVSLGSNNTMDLQYYRDIECSDLIEDTICYVNPGDIIYAKYPLFKTAGTDRKLFDTFKVYYYNEKGERNHDTTLECVNETGASVLKVLQIPESYDYTNLSVVPVSTYEDRVLTLYDYYIDKSGEKVALDNKWKIYIGNEIILSTIEDTKKFNPFNDYIVSLEFDPNEYYFSKSSPDVWHYDNDTGYVEFHQQNATEAISEFNVELTQFTPITFDLSSTNIKADFILENRRKGTVDNTSNINEVRGIEDDILLCKITSNPNTIDVFNLLKNNRIATKNLKLESCDDKGTWKFKIINSNKKMVFNPNIFTYKNGKIEFYIDNNCITAPIEVNEGEIIKCKPVPDEDCYINVNTDEQGVFEYEFHYAYSEYDLKTNFKFVQKEKKTLKQPKVGGKIIYYYNNREVEQGQDCIFYLEGHDHLTAKFVIYPNFKPAIEISDDMEITFADNLDYVKFNGIDVDNLFIPTDDSKASLNVKINKNVGNEIKFKSESWDVSSVIVFPSEKTPVLSKEIYYVNELTFFSGDVSPAGGFNINIFNGNIPTDKALRFEINCSDSDKDYTYIRYANHLPNTIEVPFDPNKIYNRYTITIDKVDIEAINFDRYSILNSDVSFRFTDETDNPLISNGQLIDDLRKVEMLITPKPGYKLYNKGKRVSEYKISCKYSELFEKYRNAIGDIDAKLEGVQ